MNFNTSNPSGFPEFSPAAELVRQSWIRIISEVYQKYGFTPIETPIIERTENLLGKGGNAKEMYVLERLHADSSDKEAEKTRALRFDQTVPLALYIARHFSEITFPFKRSVIGPVFRGERAQKGRFRQFDQCDIDIIGNEKLSFLNDALIPAIIIEIFEKLNLGNFVVRINNRKILMGLFASLGIPEEKMKTVLDIVDDREKIPADQFEKRLETLGIDAKKFKKVAEIVETSADILQIKTAGFWEKIQHFCDHDIFEQGISELKCVMDSLEKMSVSPNYCVDFGIARGLDYYTGTVYETKISDHPAFGSVCSGGRYEDLAKIFTGKPLPGVGISIGLTRLFSQCLEAGMLKTEKSTTTQVLLISADDSAIPALLKLGNELRTCGIAAENYLEDKKLAKKLDYAAKLKIPFAVIAGEDEVKFGTVNLKNMFTGEQTVLKSENLKEWILERK